MTQTLPKPAPIPAAPPGGYRRVDVAGAEPETAAQAGGPVPVAGAPAPPQGSVRWIVIPVSVLLCLVQAVATIVASNTREMLLTVTLVPVVAFAALLGIVLVVNPLLRTLQNVAGRWFRPLSRVELVCIFSAMLVTAGVSTFGLTEQLIPTIPAPFNSDWSTPQSDWKSLTVHMNPRLYLQDPATISKFYNGITTAPDGKRLVWPRNPGVFSKSTWGYFWDVFRQVPWAQWVQPLSYWMIFVAGAYGIFYCLTYVVLSYWSDREKLIFPLARLPESLMPGDGVTRSRVPPIFKSPIFWIGVAISFGVWSWNASCAVGALPADLKIPLGMNGAGVRAAVTGTIFQGLSATGSDEHLMFLIIFTAIGISFLLPLEVSFSVWFYYLAGRFVLLLFIWAGRGQSILDFPTDFIWLNNPVTALGAGGVFAFAALCLFRCLRDYMRLGAGKTIRQRLGMGVPVVGLAVSMSVVAGWLMWNRLPLGWALLFVFCLTLVTLGIMRIVAEAGIYVFQAHAGFFHLYSVLGLGKFLAPILMAPLVPIYSVMFMDIKTFMAPNLLNAADMEKRAPGSRWRFHVNLVLCIVLSVVVSLATAIFLAHVRGAKGMERWFYNDGPIWIMNSARSMMDHSATFDLGKTLWYVAGAAWVGLSVILRASFFWFPHPVGFIMLINPLAAQFWFSFFIGWVCKKIVVRYGGKSTFDKVRGMFIGLILGELMAIFFWTVYALVANVPNPGVTLNRYG